MTTADEDALAAMTSGARVYFLPAELGGGFAQLQWIADGDLWRLRVRGEQLAGFDRVSGARYDLAQMLPGNASERLCALDALPSSIWERARVIPQRTAALVAAVRAGNGWLRTTMGWWVHDPRLGDLQILPGPPLAISPGEHLQYGLPEQLWSEPGLAPSTPPDAVRTEVVAALDAVADEARRVLAGELALADRNADGELTLIFALGGRMLWFTLAPDAKLPERVQLNPYLAVVAPAKLHEVLLQQRFGRPYERRWKLEPVPEEARRVAPQLSAGLARSKREILDAYLERMRAGMTLSGGPTSDQSWTIAWEGSGFWISGYTTGPDGYERTHDPIAEAKIREMLSTMEAFGLNTLPD